MKRILLTTTSLVLAAGVAQAEVTFSGKAEAGVSRTSKADAVTAVNAAVEFDTTTTASTTLSTAAWVDGALKLTAASGTAATSASNIATDVNNIITALENAKQAVLVSQNAMNEDTTAVAAAVEAKVLAAAQAEVARLEFLLSKARPTAAVKAVAAGDMVAYSGYDMEVAVSSTLDNGMVVSAGFDMGAGSIADRDDDRVLDAQAAAVALSAVTIKNGGVTYVIGQDKIDDLYDDTQNGDVSVSGSMGGISYTLVTDLDKDTAAVAQSYTAATGTPDGFTAGVLTDGGAAYTAASYVAGSAAVYESTSLKLSGAVAGATWSFTTTNKDDFGDAASLVTLGYAAGDALSFTLKHDTDGAAEAINTLSATYTMDAISFTVSAADDKDHARNTNKSKKASQNMTIAYANGPLTASFNNDESSQWWVTSAYDLGNGADIFATVDHTEFAVVGLSFNF
ncbi:hypothetical protein N9W03_01400 [Planktomarina temperata]|nr:hypothetical protein [Planktomarina temperata]